MKHHLPLFYHPVTILALGFSDEFLYSLDLELGENFHLLTITDPRQTPLCNFSGNTFYNNIITTRANFENDFIDDYLIELNVNNLHKLMFNKSRFHYPVIAIIDSNFTEMKSIEYCRQMNKSDVLKIILTDGENSNIAIDAFNEGLIEKYLIKKGDDFPSKLLASIKDLVFRFFYELSRPFIESRKECLKSLLKSDPFLNIFKKIKADSHAVEYYLLDNSGSFIFLDETGEPSWLIIKSNEDFENQIKMLDGFDVTKDILASLKSREKLLCLFTSDEYKKPIEQWNEYIFVANKLGENHYFTLVKGRVFNLVNWNDVHFFRNS